MPTDTIDPLGIDTPVQPRIDPLGIERPAPTSQPTKTQSPLPSLQMSGLPEPMQRAQIPDASAFIEQMNHPPQAPVGYVPPPVSNDYLGSNPLRAAAKGALMGGAKVLQGADALLGQLKPFPEPTVFTPQRIASFEQSLNKNYPTAQTVPNTIGGFAGGAVPGAAAMIAAPEAAIPIFAGQGAAQGAAAAQDEAMRQRQAGAAVLPEQEQRAIVGYGAAGGLAGAIGGKAFEATGQLPNFIGRIGANVAAGGGLAGAEQLGQNAIARQTIEPDRPLTQNVAQAAGQGAIAQGVFGLGGEVGRLLKRDPLNIERRATENVEPRHDPLQIEATQTPAEPEGNISASENSQAAEVHGNVRQPTEPSEGQMPVAESGQGVQPQETAPVEPTSVAENKPQTDEAVPAESINQPAPEPTQQPYRVQGQDRLRAQLQDRASAGKTVPFKQLDKFRGEQWADELLVDREAPKPKAQDTISARRDQLTQQLRDMIVQEHGMNIADISDRSPLAMQVGRGEAPIGSLISPETAFKLAGELPEDHPAQAVLHNLKELEKNPRGTKFLKVNTSDVEDGSRLQVNDKEVLTIDREEGVVKDGVTAQIPEGGMDLYGRKVLPPDYAQPESTERPEQIKAAAFLHEPSGKVYQGENHGIAMSQAKREGHYLPDLKTGFVTDANRFVNDAEAANIAKTAKQFKSETDERQALRNGLDTVNLQEPLAGGGPIDAQPESMGVSEKPTSAPQTPETAPAIGKPTQNIPENIPSAQKSLPAQASEPQSAKPRENIQNPIPQEGEQPAAVAPQTPLSQGEKTATAPTSDTGIFNQEILRPATGKNQAGLFHEPVQVETPQAERIGSKEAAKPENTEKMFQPSSEGVKSPNESPAPADTEPSSPVQKIDDLRARAFRKQAETLAAQIEDKRRPMTQNSTPKRDREYRARTTDADVLDRVRKGMLAIADARESGTLPPELADVKTKADIAKLVAKKMATRGGYYDAYYETPEYESNTPAAKTLQGMLEKKITPEDIAAQKQQEIGRLESNSSLRNIQGFFPTPKPVVQRMLDRADIKPGQKVLEPSAGRGDIADAMRQRGADVSTAEINSNLRDVLKAKEHKLVGDDFLEHTGRYDRIVMNPPFEKGQDVEHVQHAYEQLKPGGKLVALMSEGTFSRSDRKSSEFRNWLNSRDGTSEKLDPGAFTGPGAFRQTGVAARMVTIGKPSAGGAHSSLSAAGVNDPYMDAATGKSSLQNLTENIAKSVTEKAASIKERMQAGSNVGAEQSAAEKAPPAVAPVIAAHDKLKGSMAALFDAYKAPPKDTTYDKATRYWSGADNLSALEIQRFQKAATNSVPDKTDRGAIGIYMEAGGDQTKLDEWAKDIAGDPKTAKYSAIFKRAANLGDDHKLIANATAVRNDATLAEGKQAGLLKDGIDDYLMHVWKDNPKMLRQISAQSNWTSLSTNPSITKQRTIPTYYDGIKLGMTPRDLDFSSLTAAHERSFRQALAARAYIKTLNEGKASDGRPLATVSPASAQEITWLPENKGDTGYLVKPNLKPTDDFGDYRVVDHPALRGWRWAGKDSEGKPIYVQGDMLVHPEIYRTLKNNLTPSAIQSNPIGSAVLRVGSEMKHAILSFSGFHQTTLGVHAMEHRVAPAFVPEIDASNPVHKGLIDHGLMVAHYSAAEAFGEGVASGGLMTKIPVVGPLYQQYADYLFKGYLPRVKMAMATHALERNQARYGKTLSQDQIYSLTADQANAAFGGLNYRALGRNKTFQDVLRLGLLAPDFLEARARFAAQALKPFGREQAVALGVGAAAMYTAGAVLNQIVNGDPHLDKPFTLVHDGKEYSLRSIQGDLLHLAKDPRGFLATRLSPLTSFAGKLVFDRARYGKPTSTMQLVGEAAKKNVPMAVQEFTRDSNDSTARRITESILKMIGVSAFSERNQSEAEKRHDVRQKAIDAIRGKTVSTTDALKDVVPAQRTDVLREARRTDAENQLSHMNVEKAMEFYEQQKPEDKAKLQRALRIKIVNSKIHNGQEKRDLLKKLEGGEARKAG